MGEEGALWEQEWEGPAGARGGGAPLGGWSPSGEGRGERRGAGRAERGGTLEDRGRARASHCRSELMGPAERWDAEGGYGFGKR